MTDYKFDIDGKKLSSKEINAKKDFDSFYKGVQAKGKAFYQKGWFWASTGLATVVLGALLIVNIGDLNTTLNEQSKTDPVAQDNLTEKPFINPPFDDLRVEFDVFQVDANKGGIFKSRHGSILRIPAFAFFNKKGKTITNQTVDLKFTEYKDVADQIISGIPMTYDSAGTKYMFSSAGMVEVRGYIGDSAVNLNPEKPIEVEMKSNYSSTEYNFYCLDEKNKKWEYLGKDSVSKPEPKKLTQEEINAKIPIIKKEDIVIPKDQIDAELQKAPEYQKRKRKRIQIQAQIDELSLAIPSPPRKADENTQKFSLDIIEKENPELCSYKDVQFQLAPGETINPIHANTNWNKVDLKKLEGEQLMVTFSKTNSAEEVKYKVIPVLEGLAYEKAHEEYLNMQSKLQNHKKALKEVEKKIKFFAKQIRSQKIDEGLVKAKLERLERIATLEKAQFTNKKIKAEVIRFFQVENFGVYNCDRMKKMQKKEPELLTTIHFKKDVNEALIIDVFPELNGIFSHLAIINEAYEGFENSKRTIGLVNNQIGILQQIDNGQMVFKVMGKPRSKSDLAKWLEL